MVGHAAARVSRAATRWPAIDLEDDVLQDHLQTWSRLRVREADEPADPAELFIAIACIANAKGALAMFEQHYMEPAMGALHTYDLSADEIDEVRQRMRVRLLVDRRAGTPVLLHCAGYGRLGGLVRVVLVREAARLRRTTLPADLPIDLLDDGTDASGALAAGEHQTLLKAALEHATAALDVRLRNVLRLHYVRGVSGSQIARLHGVHRGTAARWLTSARAELLRHVRRYLLARAPELGSWSEARLRELVHSQLELSLSRLLAD